ncbi:tetratricopeptide repeat protein [Pseudomonas frederiksbergensis]|uniref:Uncharacterized protein n=1 Tax=Pseudomonas frederiksbergensis TaxID=104087 RepID=A0A423KKN3_9PSED|nr:tetratricopeptide repeat protein [Pseudomonas frederiksbergensis]RON53956.1 hypothetical protein BK665_13735 [Pseudomonas frederiksbergensis]
MKNLIVILYLVFIPFVQAGDAASDLPVDIKDTISEKGYPAAKAALKTYIETNPESYFAYSALGKATAIDGDYKQSINYLERAKTIKDANKIEDASIYNSIGWVRFLNGDTAGAIADINTAIESKSGIEPKVKEAAYNNLGLIYMTNNETEKAKQSFDQAITEFNSSYAKENLVLMDQLKVGREQQANHTDLKNLK